MKIPIRLNLDDERIRELIRQEMSKYEFEIVVDIKKRLERIEETLIFYKKLIREGK